MGVKISSFIISLIIIGLCTGVLGLYMSELSANYNVDYDNDSLEVYNKLAELHTTSEEIQNRTTEISEKTGVLDVIGSLFSDAYSVLLITKDSFDTFDTISNKAIDDANLGAAGEYFRIAIAMIILILIFVGVLISAIVKRDL